MYTPNPMDTSNITLPPEITDEVLEILARNTHEVWSLGRIQEGWTYGKEKDSVKKTHPCLIPYDDLPESEKEYDKRTSCESLLVLLKLGYKISF